MPESVLEAIKMGIWDYEPGNDRDEVGSFKATIAMPGTDEKLAILAERVACGLPLWHPGDRRTYDDIKEILT